MERHHFSSIHFLIFSILFVLLSGCSVLAPPYVASAFGEKKVYALVTVVSPKDVEGGETSTLRGTFSDAKYYYSAKPALNASIHKIEKAMANHIAYRLYPPAKLKKHRAYRTIRSDNKPRNAIIPPRYKFVVTDKKLSTLAKKLGVDGVIVLKVGFGFKFYGNKYFGIAASGKTNPKILVDMKFIDRDGKVVYQTKGTKIWSKGVPSNDQGAVPKALNPLLVKAVATTVRTIANRLDTRVKSK
ncbi:MAG TPA: hypothetical protein ENJ28_06510 [Gammaproteobacteria bacterium]|nr:hypothetical protein [Gammaproteobacteria bacterium]